MWCFAKKKGLHESCRIGRHIDADSLVCSLGHCECDGHTVHKLIQRCLTADWLALQGSDCSRVRSKVSSDCLPSYIKATRRVLQIFKMAGYFLDRPRAFNDKELLIGLSHISSGPTSQPLNVLYIEVYSLCSTSNIHGIMTSYIIPQQTVSLSSATHI